MSDETLLIEVADGAAVVTLNRPHKRNALDRTIMRELPRVMAGLDERDDVAVVILTGADPAFCAGLDLVDAVAPGGVLVEPPSFAGGFFAPLSKPLIGAVNGPTYTGGLELAMECDWLIASERATFGDTHARVGVHPGGGMTVRLPRLVGPGRARQMSATGLPIDAHTALTWGLVTEVLPHADLLPRAHELAAAVTRMDQPALREIWATYRGHQRDGEAADMARELTAGGVSSGRPGYDGDAIAARRDAMLGKA